MITSLKCRCPCALSLDDWHFRLRVSCNSFISNHSEFTALRTWRNLGRVLPQKVRLCYDSKEDTLFKAVILSLLRDGGELSLMNGDDDLGGINLPRLWLFFFRNVNTYRVTSWSDDNNNVPVKSKLQHPSPGQPHGHLNFWKIFVQIPPSPGRKAVQMPPPPGRIIRLLLQLFSSFYIMLLKLCM